MRRKIIYLDMDGVIADFVGGVLNLFNMQLQDEIHRWTPGAYWINDGLGIDRGEIIKRVKENEDFWYTIRPYPWARKIVDLLMDSPYMVYIATTPMPEDENCVPGKTWWLYKHFNIGQEKTIFIHDKYLLSRKNTALIDDSEINCNLFSEYGGVSYLFPQAWNKNSWLDVYDYIEYIAIKETRKWLQ